MQPRTGRSGEEGLGVVGIPECKVYHEVGHGHVLVLRHSTLVREHRA